MAGKRTRPSLKKINILFFTLLLASCSTSFYLGYVPSEFYELEISFSENVSSGQKHQSSFFISTLEDFSQLLSENSIFSIDSKEAQRLNSAFFEKNDLLIFIEAFSGEALFLMEIESPSAITLHCYQKQTVETIFNAEIFCATVQKGAVNKDFSLKTSDSRVSSHEYNYILSLPENVVYKGGFCS